MQTKFEAPSVSAIRSVLLHLDALPSSTVRLEFARAMALRHEATLSAMFVGSPPKWPLQMAFTESPAALMQPIDWAAADRTKSVFDKALATGGVTMRWLDNDSADAVAVFCRQALYADLLVLGQHDPGAASAGAVAKGFVESVLIDTDKPALILPFEGEFQNAGNNVLIGWNATRQAARAVTAAMPWLRKARRVHVLEASDEAAPRRSGELDIAQYLQFHGVVPTLHRHRELPMDGGKFLLSLANEVGADLLVMGCYGHSRAHELMLGGASRTVLHAMTIPVLMAH